MNSTYDLPDDADDFLERPEYWIVYKNIFNNIKQASLADELCFKLDKRTGDLDFYINGALIKKCLFIDASGLFVYSNKFTKKWLIGTILLI